MFFFFSSSSTNKPFVFSLPHIPAPHMMYCWGLRLRWTTQPICEAKSEQRTMATVPFSLLRGFSLLSINRNVFQHMTYCWNNSRKNIKSDCTSKATITHIPDEIWHSPFYLFFSGTLKHLLFFRKVNHALFLTSTQFKKKKKKLTHL